MNIVNLRPRSPWVTRKFAGYLLRCPLVFCKTSNMKPLNLSLWPKFFFKTMISFKSPCVRYLTPIRDDTLTMKLAPQLAITVSLQGFTSGWWGVLVHLSLSVLFQGGHSMERKEWTCLQQPDSQSGADSLAALLDCVTAAEADSLRLNFCPLTSQG